MDLPVFLITLFAITFLVFYWLKSRVKIHTSDGHVPKTIVWVLYLAFMAFVGISGVFSEALFSILEQHGIHKHPNFEYFTLAAFAILSAACCFIYYTDSKKTPTNSPQPQTNDLRTELLNNLKELYEKRQEDKMNDATAFEIKLNLEYTDEGFAEDTVTDYNIKTNDEVGDFEILFGKYINKTPRLLIMGEPGAGKTMLLLRFGLKLIELAEKDDDFPIPILLDLASWKNEQATFKEWLEVNLPYVGGSFGISKEAAKTLVSQHKVLPLLDGFDEIATQHRNSCFEKLNIYLDNIQKRKNGKPRLIVCTRINEYKAAKDVGVNAAIKIQALDKVVVDKALKTLVTEQNYVSVNRLQKALIKTHNLYKALSSAFFVHTVLEIAQNDNIAFKAENKEALQAEITDFYIETELDKIEGYEPLKTKKYLGWLTWKMKYVENKVSFELIDMQPYWGRRKYGYKINYGIVFGFTYGYIIALVGWIVGLFYNVAFEMMISGFFIALVGGLMSTPLIKNEIFVSELKKLNLRNYSVRTFLNSLKISLYSGLSVGIITCLSIGVFFGYLQVFIFGFVLGFLLSFFRALIYFNIDELSIPLIKKAYKRFTSQFFFDLIQWIISFSIIFGLMSIILLNSYIGLILGIAVGVGIAISLSPLLQHFCLRFVLWHERVIPLRLVTFLNKVSVGGLLIRDGGKWRFRHQLIHDNLANWFEANHAKLLSKNDKAIIKNRGGKV